MKRYTVIVRMWNAEGYHKDVAVLDEQQVRMTCGNMDPATRHLTSDIGFPSVIIDPSAFPEACEFQVIVKEIR